MIIFLENSMDSSFKIHLHQSKWIDNLEEADIPEWMILKERPSWFNKNSKKETSQSIIDLAYLLYEKYLQHK